MIKTQIVKASDGKTNLIETSTTLSESKKLLQIDTGKIYFDKVVDIIIDGKSKYSYEEIDKTQEDLVRDAELLEIKNELGGNN